MSVIEFRRGLEFTETTGRTPRPTDNLRMCETWNTRAFEAQSHFSYFVRHGGELRSRDRDEEAHANLFCLENGMCIPFNKCRTNTVLSQMGITFSTSKRRLLYCKFQKWISLHVTYPLYSSKGKSFTFVHSVHRVSHPSQTISSVPSSKRANAHFCRF